jgi:hypothetical protein
MIDGYRKYICLLFLLFAGGLGSDAISEIIHVPGQMATIKSGISAANNGDTVMVSVGTYFGPGNRDLDFGGKAITVMSMKGPTLTIINCEGSWLDFHRGFYAHQGEDSTTVIEGFTIINGYAPFNAPGGKSAGGGILCINGSSPTIRDCVLYDNYAAGSGGGLACFDGSSPRVIGCTFLDNSALSDPNVSFIGYGGGIMCRSSSPVFIECIVASNRANVGGGLSCDSAAPMLDYCEFSDNAAEIYETTEPISPGLGGAVYLSQSTVSMNYCLINSNRARAGMNAAQAGADGGAISAINSSLNLGNCTLYGNIAEKYDVVTPGNGAGLHLSESSAQVENTIIANNDGGKAVACEYSDPLLAPVFLCSDIYDNELGDWTDSIASQYGNDGNFSRPPYFCDSDIGNLNLWAYSPCTPDSNECGVLIGALGAGCLTDTYDQPCCPSETIMLSQNSPNPFNQATRIEYNLPESSPVRVTIYNALGQTVRILVDDFVSAGTHAVIWDGKTTNGGEAASGLYFYAISTDRYRESKRMILLK